MSKMIQIRNVPDDLHRKLKSKAAERGVSLSDYLLRMAEREAESISVEELSARIRARGAIGGFSAGQVVRELRDELG
jgi:negative regulator of replication initiation